MPASGAAFDAVGGNTSCVAITVSGAAVPHVILDAGTGLQGVTSLLGGASFAGTILLTHLHWDHVQGLPFFAAGDRADSRVRVLMPDNGRPAMESIEQMMSPPYFPVTPRELQGDWSFETIDEGRYDVEGLTVVAREIPHKGGRTFGYLVREAGGSAAYLPDHRPGTSGWEVDAVAALVDGADVLIHDAQFIEDEARIAREYGHSTISQAIDVARRAQVGRLVLFHHAPGRTDDSIQAIAHSLEVSDLRVDIAREGDEIEL